jgi:hypothetical protein
VLTLVSSAGPFTGILEAIATSIGTGIVVGGFVTGMGSVVRGRSRTESEEKALYGGYVGGLVGLTVLGIDILGKHFV